MTDLLEQATPGLHDFAWRFLDPPGGPGRAIDLAAGSGAWAGRLLAAGYDVLAVDRAPDQFGLPGVEHMVADFDSAADRDRTRATASFELVSAVEIVEHVEAPLAFLRLVHDLLAPDGLALLTTPNVDSLPARLKFLLRGTLRMHDAWGDPTHISPIFWDLLTRVYLPATGLQIVRSAVYPPAGVLAGRPAWRPVVRAAGLCLRGNPRLFGDNHVLVLRRG